MSEAASTDPIRVIVADDHALFRRGLFMVLEGEPDIEVVAEANDGDEVVRLAEEHVPDLVLMDVRMPGTRRHRRRPRPSRTRSRTPRSSC